MLRVAVALAWMSSASAVRASLGNAEDALAETQELDGEEAFQGAPDVIAGEHGKYQLGKKLGSGAYGEVHLATEQATGTQVVVKKINLEASPEAKTSFKTERRVWMHMTGCPGYPHRNIIQYHEVIPRSAREGVVVMELAGGGSLASLLYKGVTAEGAESGTRTEVGTALLTDEAQAKRLFGQLAAGVQWLAECGVIHKDLKPDNVMFSAPWGEGGELKIIDFGLAAVLADGTSGPLANMYYNLDQSVDVGYNPAGALKFDDFALGMMLAEIGTGVPPFFNPRYSDFSTKPGNLQDEKGVMYILADKKSCAKGDVGLYYPKRALAQGTSLDGSKPGAVSIRAAVKEVVGRSLYFLERGVHFVYNSATENGIGNTALLDKSWLYNSDSAMDLLEHLIVFNAEKRIDPRALMSSKWLAGSGGDLSVPRVETAHRGHQRQTEADVRPRKRPTVVTTEHAHERRAKVDARQAEAEVPRAKPEPVKPSALPPCRNPHKKRTADPSVCAVGHYSSAACSVSVACLGQGGKSVEIGPSGGVVPDCSNCQVGAGGGGGLW
mmetsp:Transcript_106405/g.318046  ORF Transcript_106405/g.318046 Transcript_106405/m.318046 type:complete len:552 (+) Transcript_106405:54-1709(+)